MSTSHRSYEEDLPDDILELIDHTARGVQRLYEATRHTESRHKQRDPQPRRWPWSRAQALPASSTTEGRSGVTTTNTTLSSDGPFAREQERRGQLQREPRLSVSKSHGPSRVHSANSSALEESGGPRQCRRWKETFKSLLADPPAPPRSASVGPRESPNITETTEIPNIPDIPDIPNIPDIPEVPAAPNAAPFSEEAAGAQLRALRRQREEEAEAHRAAIAHMRADHQRELLEQSRAAQDERQRANEEITSRLLASFAVKQKVLRAELESERMRGDEAERSLAECRAEFADATARHCALQSEAAALSASIATLQRDIKTQREAHERDTKALKEQYEAQLSAQREAHERDTKSAAQRTEEAFADAARSYESLMRDAGEKLSALERVTRRHRQLRTAYMRRGDELKALRTAHMEVSAAAEALTRDAEKLRQVLARREHDIREEKARRCAAEAEAAESLRRAMVAETEAQCAARERDESNAAIARLEQQVAQQSRQITQQSQQLAQQAQELAQVQELEQAAKQYAEELVQQSQQAVAQRDAEMEEVRRAAAQQLTQQSQQLTQQLTQQSQQLTQQLAQQSQQSQETIASLKRQLKEKDARLGALATAAAEPVQRLRAQLEDERGRRAQLEEQFAQYKQRAKAAEEAAMREIRREQARAPSANHPSQTLAHKAHGQEALAHKAHGQEAQLSPTRAHRLPKKRPNKATAARAAGTDICAGEGPRTPTGQRAQPSAAPPAPRPHSHMWRAVSVSTASATRSPSAVIPTGVNGKDREDGVARGPWESVGSISNISCSSAYCSSDEGTGPTGRASSATRNGAPFHKHNTKEQQQQVQEEQQLYLHRNNNNINNEIHYNNGNGKKEEEEDNDDYDDDDMDRSIARHEQMLREFHQSAAEVFRKITGNRDEFLAKCTSVVRSLSPSANRPHAAIARTDTSVSD